MSLCHQLNRAPLYDRVMNMVGSRPLPIVPQGPRAYRARIRSVGPFAGLVPASLLGALSLALLHNNETTVRGIAGFLAAVCAAPALLAAGLPLAEGTSRFLAGIAGSIALWFVVGLVAARRATRSPVATWRDYWREFLWLACGIWIGVGMALAIVEVVVGRALL